MRFLILGNGSKPHVAESADRLGAAVRAAGGEVVLTDLTKHRDLTGITADIACPARSPSSGSTWAASGSWPT